MGKTNYQLTDEQKKALDKIAEDIINEIESRLSDDVGGILDPYDINQTMDNNKLTAMLWYIGDCISAC